MYVCALAHSLMFSISPLSFSIMSLQALDEHVVSDEEIIENLNLQGSFQTFSPQLRLQLLAVDCTLAHYSPVLIVQRWVRGWLTRKALAKSSNPRIR